eukprot:CAMPEP_0115649056 /NCGR_PEP_ID=MMETSP0272-20121206/40294_1 /TAXON_ID=71861 /ORGANISM="Scrippsiella trochoidea, Strain CCMP3099" /LENGTH=455 /DNA_ID=CAMNT_0003086693 /DNA_START=57 /DNA_END=1421 /DNA_ORIENTATION=-
MNRSGGYDDLYAHRPLGGFGGGYPEQGLAGGDPRRFGTPPRGSPSFGYSPAARSKTPPRDIGATFESVDRNKDGLISGSEFRRFREGTNPHRSGPTGEQVFKLADRDGDGAVTLHEFKRFHDAADLNRDGVIGDHEYAQFENMMSPLVDQERFPARGGSPSPRGYAGASAGRWAAGPAALGPSFQAGDRTMPARAPVGSGFPGGLRRDEALDSTEEQDVLEFLEGLLEGFRAAAGLVPKGPAGEWSDLDALAPSATLSPSSLNGSLARGPGSALGTSQRTMSPLRSPAAGGDAANADPVSTLMRRHALRAFLEETCETVANAFDVMASLTLRASLGGSGTQQDRLRHTFTEEDFRRTLSHLGYGVGASTPWWRALFVSLDVDNDGAISLQDMYDALVLYLPPMPDTKDKPEVFFSSPEEETWRRKKSLYAPHSQPNAELSLHTLPTQHLPMLART